MKQSNAGFTLMELLMAILCTSIVTVAAMSFLLMGMRMTGESNDAAEQQQTVRILLTMLENMAGSGQIKEVRTGGQGWAVLDGSSEKPLLQYANKAIKSGGGTVLLDDLEASAAKLEGNLLTVTVETEKGAYTTSVYCRTKVEQKNAVDEEKTGEVLHQPEEELIPPDQPNTDPEDPAPDAPAERKSRLQFLTTLAGQHGSDGRIMDQSENAEYQYFSEWYIEGYGEDKPGWNKDTPWCACFVSWAAAQREDGLSAVPRFCDVDDGMKKFKDEDDPIGSWRDGDGYTPIPGDCIFFDWSGGDDPAHVGVVFYVDDEAEKVYTIEGNSSGRVALRVYGLKDPCIVGYGVLNWKQ